MFFEQFKKLCEKNGTTPTAVTISLGFSRGTMSNWKKGATPNGEAIVRIAELFNVSCDYLLTGKESGNVIQLPNDEIYHMSQKLDEIDRAEIRGEIRQMLKANKYKSKEALNTFTATYFDTPASAGTGIQLDYSTMRSIQIEGDEAPYGADYVLRISGDSMESKYSDGDFIWVQKTDAIDINDIGIFLYDGQVYIKKYTENGLVSLNPAYDIIPGDSEIIVLGKVLRKVCGNVIL